MADPYAEFGGSAVQQNSDPYAEFGGSAQAAADNTPPQVKAQRVRALARAQAGGYLPGMPQAPNPIMSASPNTLGAVYGAEAEGPLGRLAAKVPGLVNAVAPVAAYRSAKSLYTAAKTGQLPPEVPRSLGDVGAALTGTDKQYMEQKAAEGESMPIVSEAVASAVPWLVGARAAGADEARLLRSTPRDVADSFAAATKGAGAKATRVPVAAEKAAPVMAETLKTMGPVPKNLAGLKSVIAQTNARLEGMYQTALQPHANAVVSGQPVANAILQKITPELIKNEPATVDALRAEATKYQQNYTIGELDAARRRLNSDLDAFYQRDAKGQAIAMGKTPAQISADVTAAGAIRDLLYDQIQQRTGIDFQPIKMQQKNLDTLRRNIVRAEEKANTRMAAARDRGRFSQAWSDAQGMHITRPASVVNKGIDVAKDLLLGPRDKSSVAANAAAGRAVKKMGRL